MSDLLSLGLSGLTAYRNALSAVGENVANAETPGFARRTVRLTAGIGDSVNSDPVYREGFAFGGVQASALVRNWDIFRSAEARHSAAGAGRTDVREQWLTGVETALGDGPGGIGSRITGFFNAADTLATAPSDPLNRSRLLLALDDVAGAFRTTADSLTRVATGLGAAAQLDTEKLNQSMAALARINGSLLSAPAGGTARAALEDERDRLIDSISSGIDVVTTLNDHGGARVDLADAPGTTLVGPGTTASFALTAASDGRLSIQLTTSAGTIALSPSSGKLAGYVDASAAVADRRIALDDLATDFAADINAWSAAGRDKAGNPGVPLLSATGGAAGMRGLVTDGALVPAAAPAGAANGNLLTLSALRGEDGAERRWTGMVAGHAQILSAARSENAAAKAWRDNSFAALDETTGIDLDREAADLLRYQQAYSASARIIQVGRETIDAILGLF
jgi:flagellar hook-associated protein 1 FlgK